MAYIDNVTNILQIQPDGLPTFVRLSQNENGRNLYFQLAGNEIDIPSNATVTISGTKPDGNVYSGTGSVTDNVVLIPEMLQMTAVAGTWDAKIKITSGGNTIATGRVRFIVDADTVAPGSVPSSSELEGLVAEAQQYAETARTEAYGSPLTAQTAAGMTDHTRVYVYTGSETGYTAGHWYYWDGSAWTDGGIYNSVAVNTDTTLTLAGVAADAKATGDSIEAARVAIDDTLSNTGEAADAKVVGDELTDLKSDLTQAVTDLEQEISEIGQGLSDEAKEALLDCFEHVVWTDSNGQTYYDALYDALYPGRVLMRIDAVFTQGSTVIYPSTSLNDLKAYLVVTGYYGDGTSEVITNYTLSGQLTVGTSTITVAFEDKTDSFDVLVTSARRPELPAEYEQVEYIKSTGTQWIILDDILSQVPFKVAVKASYQAAGKLLVSAAKPNGNSFYPDSRYFLIAYINSVFAARVGNNNWTEIWTDIPSVDVVYNIETALSYGSNGAVNVYTKYDNGENTSVSASSTIGNIIGNAIQIFRNAGDGVRASATLYEIIMQAGNNKLFDGIPCYRKSDNVSGLYDAVNEKFWPSDGTANFEVGEIIE